MDQELLNRRAEDVLARGTKMLADRGMLLDLWQEIADNFYPERGDFTYSRSLGSEFAAHLMDSFPVLVRRDLGNAITTMLRPRDRDWGEMSVLFDDNLDLISKQWLDWAWQRQRRAMYQPESQFTKATKEADHDFASFGQAVIRVQMNGGYTGLQFQTQHLRDCAWCENEEQVIDQVFVRRQPFARDLLNKYGEDRLHPKVIEMATQNGGRSAYERVPIIHIVVPYSQYDMSDLMMFRRTPLPYVSLYIDVNNRHVIEAVPSHTLQYVIPRWQTVSGSQYAYSPATIVGLPDARLIQAVTLTLLEAGEQYVRPPLIATEEVVRSDMQIYSGGVTWIDADYDERLGQALRPLTQDKSGMPVGFEMSDRQKEQLKEVFYLNQIRMPPIAKEATAYEVSQMVQEYIRNAMPLFEPMEYEYNGALCEEVFSQLFHAGAFGSPLDVPPQLQSRDIDFKFRSPLHDADGRQVGQKFLQTINMAAPIMQVEPGILSHVDIHQAFRDAVEGLDIPMQWMRPEKEAMQAIDQAHQAQAMQQVAQTGGGLAEAVKTVGQAGQELSKANAAAAGA